MSVAACLFGTMEIAQAGKGGRRRTNNDGPNNPTVDDGKIDWHDTVDEALDWAKKNKKPVMLVIRRAANKADLKLVAKLSEWPVLVDASTERFAAVKGAPRVEQIQDIAKLAGVKTLPAIVWLDQYGNPVKTQAIPDSVNSLAEVVKNWPALIAGVEKMLKDKVAQADKLASQGHLHEAYTELSALSEYKGPDAEAAQKAREKVKQKWTALAEMGTKQPAGSRERTVIIQGLLRETQGTDFEQEMQKMVADGEKALVQTDAPKTAVAAAEPVVPVPAKPAQPATPVKPAAPAGADDSNDVLETGGHGKSLTELSTAAPVPVQSSSLIQTDILNGSTDPQIKDAAKMIQEAMTSYRQATADSMDHGAQRNNLLKSAYDGLNKSSAILLDSVANKPDARIERLVQQISMMMYGCMKYQSL